MKIKKEFAILFFLIVVLVYYISSDKGDRTHYDLPEVKQVQASDISRIKIRQGGSEFNLAKDDGKWLVGDMKYMADSAMVKNMIDKIAGLSLTALASETKNYSIYDLGPENRIEVVAFKGESPVIRFFIGKPASSYRHTFVMLDDDHRVYHASGNIKADFAKKVSDLRDKKVMTISDEVVEITLISGTEELTMVKSTAPVSVDGTSESHVDVQHQGVDDRWTRTDGMALKDDEVEGLISFVSSLLCDEFIEGRKKAEFNTPLFTAVLKGINTYSISLFEQEGGKYPAISSGSEYPFMISEWKAEKIMKVFPGLVAEDK